MITTTLFKLHGVAYPSRVGANTKIVDTRAKIRATGYTAAQWIGLLKGVFQKDEIVHQH